MAKLQDKFFNRVIEGKLELDDAEKAQQQAEALEAVEDASGLKILESIEDAQGHKRFIEGNGTPLEQEGVSITYCKWSLSGSHLMTVIAGTIAKDTVLSNNTRIGLFILPEWLMNKIYPVYGALISYVNGQLVNTNYVSSTLPVYFDKEVNDIACYLIGVHTASDTYDESFRIQFDLLIDNEAPAE